MQPQTDQASQQLINFSGLEKYESPRTRARWEKVFAAKTPPKRTKQVLIIIAVFAAIFILFGIGSATLNSAGKPVKVGFDIVIGVVIAFILIRLLLLPHKRKKAAAQFAADNGWQVLTEKPQLYLASITPSNASSYGVGGPVVAGQLDGCNFQLYQYSYTVIERQPSADQQTTTQSQTVSAYVLTFQLPASLPAFFLDAKMDGSQEAHGTLFNSSLQKLSLEGDFDHYFSLYQQPGGQIDVLSIFTPEFMQALMKGGAFLNIQSDGNQVHFISPYGDLLNATPTRHLFEQSRMVLGRILFKLQTYQPSATAAVPAPAAVNQPG